MRQKKGFTIIELLIIITILSLLLVAGFLAYLSQINRGYDALRKSDLNNLKIAFENYYSDHGCYPNTSILQSCNGTDLLPYLDRIPCDPQTKLSYELQLDTTTGCAQKFYVFTDLTNVADPMIYCKGQYMVHSANVTQNEIDIFCSEGFFCDSGYYGCISGTCTLVSAVGKPSCSKFFCSSACQNSCTRDDNEDGIYDFEYPCPL